MFPAKVHRGIYIVLVTLLGGCMVCSTWAANLMWVLLGANWVLEGRWREKWQMFCRSRLLQAWILFYLMLLVGMCWTQNTAAGWSVLQVKLPLLVVPLVMLTTPAIAGRARRTVLRLFTGTVLVVSIIATVRLFTIPDLPYREAVPYISHIRFALCCCMVLFFLMGTLSGRHWFLITIRVLLILWFLCFLVLLRSYTAVAVLLAVSLVAVIHHRRRWYFVVLWLLAVGGIAFGVTREVRSYYRLCPLAEAPLQHYTAGGRPYFHARDGIIENGNYLNDYICIDELRAEWPRRSRVPLADTVAGGYGLDAVLIRHLNALGLTKDSVGIWAMPDEAVRAVERGVANPVYESRNPLRKMVYVMLLEREHYVHTGSVQGFTMLQRFELWRATWRVICENPVAGVGTGDAVDAMHSELAKMDSELAGTYKTTHNQYLSLIAMVGFLGFALILLMFLRALLVGRPSIRSPHFSLMLAWLVTILVSFLTEDTLATLAGILFCTWFLAMRPRGKGQRFRLFTDN